MKKICPVCKREYEGQGAASRYKSQEVCPVCGTREAMEIAGIDEETKKKVLQAAESPYLIKSLLPDGESFVRMYFAYEGGLRLVSRDAKGEERRYFVTYDEDGRPAIELHP